MNIIALKCICNENFEHLFLTKIENLIFPMNDDCTICAFDGEKGTEISICFQQPRSKIFVAIITSYLGSMRVCYVGLQQRAWNAVTNSLCCATTLQSL